MCILPLVQTGAALLYAFTPSRSAFAFSGWRCVGISGVPAWRTQWGRDHHLPRFDPYTSPFGDRRAPVRLFASHMI
jgi:hypothetical protein